jgi:single-strand DNA-binding protein
MAGTDLNRVTIIGRFVADPEQRFTPNGTAVASFTLANSRAFTQNGEKKEQTSFFDFVAWSNLSELITKWCHKGDKVAIEGRLNQKSWSDSEGKKRSKVEITVENIQFLSSAKKSEEGSTPAQTPAAKTKDAFNGQDAGNFDENPFNSDDIPF